MKLRSLSFAILVSCNTGMAFAADGSIDALGAPPALAARPATALEAAQLAAPLLDSAATADHRRAVAVLAECDAALHPICRVDMGLAMALLALDDALSDEERASYSAQAKQRLFQAAGLGNARARLLLSSLQVPAERAVATGPVLIEPEPILSVPVTVDVPLQPVVSRVGRRSAGPNATSSVAVLVSREPGKGAPTSFNDRPAPPSEPHPTAAGRPAPAVPVADSTAADLERALAELTDVRAQLLEANNTISSLRSMLSAQRATEQPAFDPAWANRRALDAALSGDYETAIPLFRKAAEANHVSAINNLAVLYVNATGVPRDMQQALKLFERAAELGSMEAAENAARIYNYGIGRSKDPSRARSWYKTAQKLGSQRAGEELAEMERSIAAATYF